MPSLNFQCKPGCSACCTVVFFPKGFIDVHKERIQREIEEIAPWKDGSEAPVTKDLKCPFLTNENKCAVYEDRPEVCRAFGLVPKLPCPYIRPDGKARTPGKARQMERQLRHETQNSMRRIERKITGKFIGSPS